MKRRIFLMIMAVVALLYAPPAMALGLGDIRVNARFLTDRMAFELKLNQRQYNDLYEINFDFFSNVDPYLSGMALAEARAMDAYYRYLDERNDDLRWILSNTAYVKFMSIDYFFRPVYAVNNVCYLRVYKVYPDRKFFYYGLPPHYYTYRGAHARIHCGGVSYYKRNFKKYYNHRVYTGHYQCRPEHRPHDFGRPAPSVKPNRPVPPPSRPVPPPSTRPPHRNVNDRKPGRYERREIRKERRNEVKNNRKSSDRSSMRERRTVSGKTVREI